MLNSGLCPWLAEPLESLIQAQSEQRLAHGWLIHGPAGIGKTNLALVFATRLLEGTLQGEPPAALSADEFLQGMLQRHEPHDHHPDLHCVHPAGGKHAIGVEQIRDVCETLSLSSYGGSGKVAVIEPAEAMTSSAANALLKTLEEPAGNSYLMLVSHRPGLLPATIRSRCQQLAVRGPSASQLARWSGERAGAADALEQAAPPLSALQWLEGLGADDDSDASQWRRQLLEVLTADANPLAVADAWVKGDADHVLAWLIRMLHGLIRLRCVEDASKLVTESADASLHNAARALSLRTLFQRAEDAERLRSELTGGINVQLAMRALLLGFVSDKGMT